MSLFALLTNQGVLREGAVVADAFDLSMIRHFHQPKGAPFVFNYDISFRSNIPKIFLKEPRKIAKVCRKKCRSVTKIPPTVKNLLIYICNQTLSFF